MQVMLLGTMRVVAGPHDEPVRLSPGERSLLALLAIAGGRGVSTDRLIDGLWPHALPADPVNALHLRVSKLRRLLPGAVVHDAPGYRLAEGVDVDVHLFEQRVAERRFTEALALWRGEPFTEFAEHDWARDEATRLRELRAHVMEELLEQRLAAGEHEHLIGDAKSWLGAHPLRDRLRGQLMLALHRSGRSAEALEVYQDGYRLLDDQHGVSPSPTLQTLQSQILADDPALTAPVPVMTSRGNIGQALHPLIGRRGELARLQAALEENRVVTVTGPGGAGKTTTALALARAQEARYRDGCWLVRLAEVPDGAAVPAAIVHGLSLDAGPDGDPSGQLGRRLRDRQLLLVLDNCEHVVDACAKVVEEVLGAGVGVRVLATSREALGVPGEALIPMPPLPPHDGARLFVVRARAVRPGLRIGIDDPVVGQICERLDGMPLAIELAAARVGVLTPNQLLDRLRDRFGVLTAGPRNAEARHRTLRSVIDWSHGLLTDEARKLLRRLSVFAGGCTIEAAEDVCAEPGVVVLDVLDRLVAQSMVVASDDGRFDLLQTVRAYAGERLAEDPDELMRTRLRHADYFTRLAEEAATGLRGPDQRRWLQLLRNEDANLRAALDWGQSNAQHAEQLALRLAASLGWYWYVGRQADGRGRLATILASASTAPTAERAAALQSLSLVLRPAGCIVHAHAAAADAAKQSRAAFELLGLEGPAALSGLLEAVEGVAAADPSAHLAEVHTCRRRLLAAGDRWGGALADFVEMELSAHLGNLDAALETGRRAAEAFDELDDAWGRSAVRLHLGIAMRLAGRTADADRVLAEVVAVATESALPNNLLRALVELGESALHRGDPVTAERRLAEAEQVAVHVPDSTSEGLIASGRGAAARLRGDHVAAVARYTDAVRHLDAAGAEVAAATARVGLGAAMLDTDQIGDHEALAILTSALESAERHADAPSIAAACEQLARVAARKEQHGRCADLLARAEALRSARGLPAPAVHRRDVDQLLSGRR